MTQRRAYLTVIARVAAASALAVAAVLLGHAYAHAPLPAVDAAGERMLSVSTAGAAIAISFFASAYGITAVSIALFLVALATRRGFVATVAVVLIQLASAQTVSVMKHAFDRARPTSHIVLEAMPSYPSGHAAGAVAFYGGVAWLVWQSRLTAFWKRCATGMLIVLMIGIGWSRIALGAHYVTDVLGGYLVGAAWLLAGTAIFSAQVSKGRSR